ncbi:MAG: alpha/beta fold hydrolase [Candidatus Dormibacteraeota bacterium]|nr:alpha/beta fold hydrolase [Candidatus Dormibacteraeota bacterium]
MATLEQPPGARADAGFEERFVEAGGFTVRHLTRGSGDTTVVYLHGGGGLHISPVHRLLSERFHVAAFEMPGFGSSPENTRSASLDDLAATMAEAIAAAGTAEYALYGTSFGAAVALRIAISHPERVRALILESPAALRPEGSTSGDLSPERLRAALYARPENAPPPDRPEVIAKQLRLLGRLSGPNQDPELIDRMRTLSLPVLVLFGTRDGLISPSIAPRYKQLLLNGYIVYVYEAAHEMQFDRPEAVAEVVVDFVARQEAFLVNATSALINP